MQSIHFDIEPFDCWIHEEFLYNLESKQGCFVAAKIFAVSSYPGHALTFQALVDNKYVYSYLPIHSLSVTHSKSISNLDDNCYFNCPSDKLAVTKFATLKDKTCQVFNKNGSWHASGKYIMTFDWYNDNELCHLIEREDGNFILWPNHKLVFSLEPKSVLPGYKKLRQEWRIIE